jgi:hypothetical protein
MQKNDVLKVTLYEALCNLGSATLLGFIIGVIAAIANTSFLLMIIELPF